MSNGNATSELPALPPKPRPPYLSPLESQQLFQLPPGYRLELVLSEPQIAEPVVTVFDGNGRMYVAEMRSYMRDIDGTNQKVATSRVSMHWSSKGDGNYDRHSVFINLLVLPRILLPLKDSLLVQETDTGDIFEYRDLDGDGQADEKKLFFAGEVRKANLEHQTSGLIWSVDNWMYSTYNSYRIRWTPEGIVKEPTAPNGGQWGLAQDNFGKPWIVNAGGELGPINFQQPIVYGGFKVRNEFSPDFKEVFPLVPIPDVQGGKNRFRPDEQTLNHFTATCGAEIFRGDRLPAEMWGDLFFCEPVGRLVRRAKVEVRDGVTYLRNAHEKSEFLRTPDPYFRPVNMTTAPDGTIYITDMYRGIIQEGNWTKKGSYLRSVILQHQLDQNFGRGRIWRLVHESTKPGPQPQMLAESPAQWVSHLAHPNGWWRDTAQKLLILQQDKAVVGRLEAMARNHANPLARIHALWTLEGLGGLTAALVREKFQDADVNVRVAAVRTSETLWKRGDATLKDEILALFRADNPAVAVQAMMTANLLKWPEAKPLIQKVAVASPSTGVKEIGAQLLNPRTGQIPQGYGGAERVLLEKGQQIYMELCFACHGLDAKGTPIDGRAATLAPPLAGSKTVNGHRDAAVNALIFGVTGPIEGHAYEAPMAGMGANDDEWIAAIASYVRTGFGNAGSLVSKADVARVRAASSGRMEPWTSDELQACFPQPLSSMAGWKLTSNHPRNADGGETVTSVTLPFSAGPDQVAGTWLKVELPEAAMLSGVRFDTAKSHRNYPRGYTVGVSVDGETWQQPAVTNKTTDPLVDLSFAPTLTRFVRITQTGDAVKTVWSVDRLTLFTPSARP